MSIRSKVLPGICAFVAWWVVAASAQPSGRELLQGLGFTSDEIARLDAGELLIGPQPGFEGSDKDLAVSGAMMVDRPLASIADALLAEVTFESDANVIYSHDLDLSGSWPDVGLPIEPAEAERMLRARPGLAMNLSSDELAAIAREQAAGEADRDRVAAAEALSARFLAERFDSYRAGGLEAIEPYARTRDRQAFPGRELALASERLPVEVRGLFPQFSAVLNDFPFAASVCCRHRFYLIRKHINERPGFVLAHRLVEVRPGYAILVERQYYVSHTYNSLQIAIAFVPYQGRTYLGLVSTAFTDRVAGSPAKMRKRIGRARVAAIVRELFGELKDDLGIAEGNDRAQ